jgi:predicted O-methyltransferase YrrM
MNYDKFMSIPGYTSLGKLQALNDILSKRQNIKTVVEVGSFCGRSSTCIAETVGPDVDVFCIDRFRESITIPDKSFYDGKEGRLKSGMVLNTRSEFEKNTLEYKNIQKIQGYFPYDVQWKGNDIDVLFLDSDHVNPNDIDILNHVCKNMPKGSLIICDDARKDYDLGFNVFYNMHVLEEAYGVKAQFDYGHLIWANDIFTIEVTKDYIDLHDYEKNYLKK